MNSSLWSYFERFLDRLDSAWVWTFIFGAVVVYTLVLVKVFADLFGIFLSLV